MSIYDYQAAFGAADKTTAAMKAAIAQWFRLYYRQDADASADPCQRIAYTVVSKIVRAVFAEYGATASDAGWQQTLEALSGRGREAVQLALVGGSCYIKPWVGPGGFRFTLIPRNNLLIFGADPAGMPTDVGTVEKSSFGKDYYTLLERRTVDNEGYLSIDNKLYRSGDSASLGTPVSLQIHPAYRNLPEHYSFPEPVGSVGLVQMKTPILNCVDGSQEGVAVFAPAAQLIGNIDANEAQLNGEFQRGESRVIVSQDMLSDGKLQDHLFVGLDEDPERVGMTVYSPALRQEAYLARKQEYLRNVESIVGLRRGMLSDANMEERTATEITSSAGDFNLTVMDFQRMWQQAVEKTLQLCGILARIYGLDYPGEGQVCMDWGNSTLYDEDKTWEDYRQMVSMGLIAPEVALGWRFNLPASTEEERQIIRERYMPQ